MNLTETATVDGCMRFGTIRQIGARNWIGRVERNQKKRSTLKVTLTRRQLTRRQLTELIFENCIDCKKMAAIPQGAFAACKVHCNEERTISTAIEEQEKTEKKENIFNSRFSLEGWELTPLKYNSKLMNSIWGLYNRYSVHNFKKNNDAEEGVCSGVVAAIWNAILKKHSPAINVGATASIEAHRIIGTGNGI